MNDLTINGIDLFIATKKAKKQSSCNPLGYLTKTVLKFSRVMLYPSFLVNKPSCGEEYKYKLSSGKIHDICEVCRADPCEICGGKKPKERVRFKTCSEACQMEKRRAYDRARNVSRRTNADYLIKEREWQKKRYAKQKKDIRIQRRERLNAMTPAEKLELENRDRTKRAEWWAKNKERMYELRKQKEQEKRRNMSEEQLAEYLKNRREQRRINDAMRRQQRRLREMMGDMNKVLEKAQNDK